MTMFTEDIMYDLKSTDWIEVDQTFLTWAGITTNYPRGKRLIVQVILGNRVIAQDDNGYYCEIPLDVANRMRARWIDSGGSSRRVENRDHNKVREWLNNAADPYLEQGFSRLYPYKL